MDQASQHPDPSTPSASNSNETPDSPNSAAQLMLHTTQPETCAPTTPTTPTNQILATTNDQTFETPIAQLMQSSSWTSALCPLASPCPSPTPLRCRPSSEILDGYTPLQPAVILADESPISPSLGNWTFEDDQFILSVYYEMLMNPLEAPFFGPVSPAALRRRAAKRVYTLACAKDATYAHSKREIRERLVALCSPEKRTPRQNTTRKMYTPRESKRASSALFSVMEEQPLQVPRVRKRQRSPDDEDEAESSQLPPRPTSRRRTTPPSPTNSPHQQHAGGPQSPSRLNQFLHWLKNPASANDTPSYLWSSAQRESHESLSILYEDMEPLTRVTPRQILGDTNAVPRGYTLGVSLSSLRGLARLPPSPPPENILQQEAPIAFNAATETSSDYGLADQDAVTRMTRFTEMWTRESVRPSTLVREGALLPAFQPPPMRRTLSRSVSARSVSARSVSARSVSSASTRGGWDEFEEESRQQ